MSSHRDPANRERLADVAAELQDVERRLAETPADDYNTRIDLRERQRDLLARAARLERARPVDRASLEAELAALERRRTELEGDRIDVVAQSGGGSSGGDFGFAKDAWELNRRIDEASGLKDIEARIREIRELLDRDAGAGDR